VANDPRLQRNTGKPRIWLWLAAIGALALMVLVGALGLWQAQGSREVANYRQEIAERGEPLTAADLEAFYAKPPEAQDTTQLWLDGMAPLAQQAYGLAVQGLPIVGDGEPKIPPPGTDWPALPAAEKLLAQYQSSLSLFHQAADAGGAARFPTAFNKGISMLLPHAQNLRNASRLLRLEAHVRAHRGDAAGALKSIHAALAVGKSLENEPLMISQLVRMACDASARQVLCDLLPHVRFADEDLVELQSRLSALDYRAGLRRGLLGERVIAAIALEDPKQLAGAAAPTPGYEFLHPLFSAGAVQVYLDFMDQTLTAADLPWPEAIGEAQRIQAELNANIQTAAVFSRMKFMLTGMVAASNETMFKAAARNVAENDAAIAAIAIERYRRQHDSFPEHLGKLVPEFMKTVPLDPFNGQPLKYVPGETGYILYNVGEDGIDNGGLGDDSGKPDDVLRIEYPTAMDAN
jgi:hypothetical protein